MKRFNLSNYSLIDLEKGREYTTGVSLADCQIPFEDLLNKLSDEVLFYRKQFNQRKNECEVYKKDLEFVEGWLISEFNLSIDELRGEME